MLELDVLGAVAKNMRRMADLVDNQAKKAEYMQEEMKKFEKGFAYRPPVENECDSNSFQFRRGKAAGCIETRLSLLMDDINETKDNLGAEDLYNKLCDVYEELEAIRGELQIL